MASTPMYIDQNRKKPIFLEKIITCNSMDNSQDCWKPSKWNQIHRQRNIFPADLANRINLKASDNSQSFNCGVKNQASSHFNICSDTSQAAQVSLKKKTTIRLNMRRPSLYDFTCHSKIGGVPPVKLQSPQDPPGDC